MKGIAEGTYNNQAPEAARRRIKRECVLFIERHRQGHLPGYNNQAPEDKAADADIKKRPCRPYGLHTSGGCNFETATMAATRSHAGAHRMAHGGRGMVLAWVSVVSALLPPAPPPRGAAIGSASPHVPSAHVQSCVAARRQAPAWRASAGDLFEPTFESAALYQQAEAQMRQLHGGKCTDAAAKALDEEFWVELESRMAPAVGALASDPSSLWRFRHFLTKQRIIALPLTGRTRIEGVTRLSLGPLKDMDQDRRQVRALAYYPGLRHQPYHDMGDFAWLRTLQSRADVIRRELDVYLSREDNMWAGNNCQDFDKVAYMYMCMCMCMCMYMYMCMCMYMDMCMCMYMYMDLDMDMYMCTCICVCMGTCMCMCMCMCMYMYMYMYMDTDTDTDMDIWIWIWIYMCLWGGSWIACSGFGI